MVIVVWNLGDFQAGEHITVTFNSLRAAGAGLTVSSAAAKIILLAWGARYVKSRKGDWMSLDFSQFGSKNLPHFLGVN